MNPTNNRGELSSTSDICHVILVTNRVKLKSALSSRSLLLTAPVKQIWCFIVCYLPQQGMNILAYLQCHTNQFL